MKRAMRQWVLIVVGFLMVATLAWGDSAPAVDAPKPTGTPVTAIAEPAPVPVKSTNKIKVTHKVVSKLSGAQKSTPRPAAPVTLVGASASQRSAYEEARNLIVPQQKYLLKFEDEESYGKLSESGKTHIEHTFSEEEVEDFQNAVEKIATYRNQMRSRCSGASPRVFNSAIEKYLSSLSMFNRKALPLVADISEANPEMILVVNRNVLVDAPVLVGRYLQFKKQRFKESMAKFSPSDLMLINAFTTVAKTLKVEISDSDWNKNYGVRENGLEMISMWPREMIYEATDRLTDAKETVCIVDIKTTTRDVKQASKVDDKREGVTGE